MIPIKLDAIIVHYRVCSWVNFRVVLKPFKIGWSSPLVANRTFHAADAGPLSESPHKVGARIFLPLLFPSRPGFSTDDRQNGESSC